jgi:GTP-binding protein
VSYPLVAIVGAPNVGKSTLFNRLVGRRHAIVTDEPGVTRDRLYREVLDGSRPFRLVDTGGLTPRTAAPFAREIEDQASRALDEAALVLFVVDGRAGASALDREIADMLRRRGVAPILLANKIDAPTLEPLVHDLHDLGFGQALPVSAEHGLGIEALLDAIAGQLDASGAALEVEDDEAGAAGEIRVAIVGRPNVGKSSILNRLVGEDRMLVSDVAGTTRDSVDTRLEVDGRRFLLVDTAGLRRRGKARLAAEVFSVDRARKSIQRADVAVLVLDADAGFAAQDAHIAGFVKDAFRPLVVAVNKWDLLEDREVAAKDWEEEVRYHLRFAKEAPMVLVSAKTGQRVIKLLDHVVRVHEAAGRRVATPELNDWLQRVARTERGAPAAGRSIRLFYATQTGIRPPRFVLFCSNPQRVHFSMRRYLENSLRTEFGFGPAPIKIEFRSRRER